MANDAMKPATVEPASEAPVRLERVARPLRGLERICKPYGRMKCGATMMVWDYANEVALPENEMPAGSKRWAMSEKAKWSNSKLADRRD